MATLIRPHRRQRFLSALCAVILATSVMHGPSMTIAENMAITPASAAAHMPQHHGTHHVSEPVSDDHATMPRQDNGAANTTPNCPLANVAAIVPVAPACTTLGQGVALALHRQAPLVSADRNAIDPPPRAAV